MGARYEYRISPAVILYIKLWPDADDIASIWVFLLLGVEAIRTFRSNPSLTLGTWQVPTWTMPLIMIVVVAALVPGTSLLGHVCSVLIGYLCKSFPAILF